MRSKIGRLVTLLVLLPAAAPGQPLPDRESGSAPEQTIATEVLVPPVVKIVTSSMYPANELLENREGWVQLGFMVDPTGKPFEVTVVDSSGVKSFEEAAVKALERAKIEPGKLNGQPVESASELKFTFSTDFDTRGAKSDFVGWYSNLMVAVKKRDRAGADAAIKHLQVTNLYEDAYFGLASFEYAQLWGDESQQLKGLERAVAREHTAHYLAKDAFRAALFQTLKLDLNAHRYGEVLVIWKDLEKAGMNSRTAGQIKPVIDQLYQLSSNDVPYDITGSMPEGSWHVLLLKKHFRVKVPDGHISDVKLRCAKGFVRFAFDPDLQYKVASKYGGCSMELEGDRGTQFTLTQF